MAGQIGIFETQLRSDWVQNMLDQQKHAFGFEEVTWRRRALMAIPAAGIEGKTLTSLEMEDALIPLIGPAPDRSVRSVMINMGMREGIMVETGKLRKPEGYARSLREYKIIGHYNEELKPVLMGEV